MRKSRAFYLLLSVAALVRASVGPTDGGRPNIVFLVVESTDGRAWARDYQNGAVSLPNIRALQDKGYEFTSHYANAPVCCPSRATFWSGRHAHNIPHNQKSSGIFVQGAWNNYEGLPPNYTLRLDKVLAENGYNVKMSGKLDYTAGDHSENVRLNAWTMYTRFPYNISKGNGGWVDEDGCVDKGTVLPGNTSAHVGDWATLRSTVKWIRANASVDPRPFFVYQGMNIVHPPYSTNQFWFDRVDIDKVRVPEWGPLEDMHPCDFQSSMLKGCLPPPSSATGLYFYEEAHRRRIRAIYLAMIAEFDAMVGEYVNAVRDSEKYDNTIFVVTSDHGDMQMEHRQFYKMVPYDASARVPMVIMDGRDQRPQRVEIHGVTQLIDIFPTVLTYAGIPLEKWPQLDGAPVQTLLRNTRRPHDPTGRPDFIVSQFHGDNIAMSWFMVVHNNLKLVVWGTGEQHPHQLFNLTADPDENLNLAGHAHLYDHITTLLDKLGSVVNYADVAQRVSRYGRDSLLYWLRQTPEWKNELGKTVFRWYTSWSEDPDGAVKAVENFLANPAQVQPCRSELVWPPPSLSEAFV